MAEVLKAAKIRCSVDASSDKLGAKIRRRGDVQGPAHALVVGAKEKEAGVVNVRSRADKSFEGNRTLAEFVALVSAEIAERRLKAHVPTAPAAPAARRPDRHGVFTDCAGN
jgi:threonyl-tRNA synthetase